MYAIIGDMKTEKDEKDICDEIDILVMAVKWNQEVKHHFDKLEELILATKDGRKSLVAFYDDLSREVNERLEKAKKS